VLQIRKDVIRESLMDFQGVEHRLEHVLKVHGIHFINDSKATNTSSVLKALENFDRVTLILSGILKEEDLEGFWRPLIYGLTCRLAQYGALLSGGDTVSTNGGLSLSLTLIGWVEEGRALMRSGARPGDLLYCSGPLGEADAGLDILKGNISFRASRRRPSRRAIRYLISRHLLPEPRVGLGRALLEAGATACIDISDGVATDAAHLAQESGCRIVIDESRLPVSRAMRLLAMQQGRGASQRRWLRKKLLSGGEDFELLWTVPHERAEGMERTVRASGGVRPVRIGRVEQGGGLFLKSVSGTLEEISFKGYEHLFLS
jgi:thiamine-monophosphate kinase